MQASLQTTADKWAAGRFWTHMERRHAQSPGTTSLYPANTKHGEVGGLEDQRAWFDGGERGKIYFYGFGSSSFGEVSCWDGLLPKRGKLSWNHQVHIMRDKEREITQIVAGKGATVDQQTKYSSLSSDGKATHRRNSDGRPVHPDQTKGVKG